VKLTYLAPPLAQTLIAHRPGPDAPETLTPFVQVPATDTPDGTTEYPVASMTAGQNARFAGTYTIVAVSSAWNSPSAARTITVAVKEYEYFGGPSYSSSVAATVTPNSLPGPLVIIGELTLPLRELPPDNLSGYFTVTITDTNTADDFQDILFLDTMGQTVIIQTATAYMNFWLDEATADRDIGLIMASAADRDTAISVLDSATVTGGPLSVDPSGNQSLLVYAVEGAPSCELVYNPRWFLDRLA